MVRGTVGILRNPASAFRGLLVRRCTVLVIPYICLTGDTAFHPPKSSVAHAGRGFQRVYPLKKTVPPFSVSLGAAMRDSASQAQGVDFDFGTSPHGLSAEPSHAGQETRQEAASRSLVDQQAPQGRAAGVCREASGGALAPTEPDRLPFALSEEQRSHLAFAALCQIGELEECDEAGHPEVQEAIRHLLAARRILEEGRPA